MSEILCIEIPEAPTERAVGSGAKRALLHGTN